MTDKARTWTTQMEVDFIVRRLAASDRAEDLLHGYLEGLERRVVFDHIDVTTARRTARIVLNKLQLR